MIAAGLFDLPSSLLAWFYSLTHSYAASIALIAVVVMVITAPLTLKSTKGMLEMQRLAPEMRKLQAQYRNDRTKLNEEMMKLYQEHKVNPLSSCLPLLAQMPVFIIMFRILYGLTYSPSGGTGALAQGVYWAAGRPGEEVGFLPRYISHDSELFQSLVGETEMVSLGLDLAKSPFEALGDSFGTGLIYLGLVVVLGVLYLVQQRMVAARAAVSPTMSPAQQKLMQYLPVAFAVFQVFFVLGLVIYYMAQAILRIGLQHYITRAFYGHDEALGRQAQRASEHARELAKQDGDAGGGGLFAQARRDLSSTKADRAAKTAGVATAAAAAAANPPAAGAPRPSKRTTEPKNRPTPSGNRPSGRPQRGGRPGGPRSKSSGKRQR
jgi:YidC/Oxa1 family membrane protein insertase